MLLVHLPKHERGASTVLGGARVAELELEHVHELLPISAFAQMACKLL
jgi:hypothetical protein